MRIDFPFSSAGQKKQKLAVGQILNEIVPFRYSQPVANWVEIVLQVVADFSQIEVSKIKSDYIQKKTCEISRETPAQKS